MDYSHSGVNTFATVLMLLLLLLLLLLLCHLHLLLSVKYTELLSTYSLSHRFIYRNNEN